MEPRIELLREKKLAGKSGMMSFADNRTRELWQWLMPRRNSIPNRVGEELYSMEVYPGTDFFQAFDPARPFRKWAAVEVSDYAGLDEEYEKLIVPEGTYAVFLHKGPASQGESTYRYIFSEWLPKSGYVLEDRPHFAVMDSRYKGEDQDSEEEIWVPVRER